MRKIMLKLLLHFVAGEPGPTKRRIGSWILRNVPGMLTCVQMEEFIHDYYEGLVSDSVRRAFDMHMKLCPMCRVHFDNYVRAVALSQKVCAGDEQMPNAMPQELIGAILLARSHEPAP